MIKDNPSPVLGRPSKFDEVETPKALLKYFSQIRVKKFMDKEYPEINTVEGFCSHYGIAKSTFYDWVQKFPIFSDAFHKCKQYQADQLFFLVANRIIDSNYGKFLTINCTDLKEKVESTVENKHQISIDVQDQDL